MLLTFHSLAGAAIASQVPNPLISWPLALVSHFVLDCLPHWDFFTGGIKTTRKVQLAILLDFSIGLLAGLSAAFLYPQNAVNILGACFFACLPDGFSFLWMLHGPGNRFLDLQISLQKRLHFKSPLPWGMVVPSLTAVGSLYFLLR